MTLQEMVTEILAGEYAQDFLGYGKDSSGNYHPIEVDVDGKQYVIDEQLATKLDTLIAKDFATETTLDTRLSNLESKLDTLLNSQNATDNTLSVSQKGSKATDAVAVTPDDVNDLAQVPTDGLYVGIGGNIKVDMADGTTVTFTALKGGVVYPFEVSRIYDTDTTATNIVALY